MIFLCAMAACSAVAGCAEANAKGLDPSNPLHCAAQFESYSIIARQQGDVAQERGFGARSQWYVDQAKSQGIDLKDAALRDVEKRISATSDGGLALATECMKRQDADPTFRELINRD
jgi:hypothetical protein